MKTARARPLEAAGAVALVLGAFAASCTYDFDQFVREPTAGASSGGHAAMNGGAAGHGGTAGVSGHSTAGTSENGENGGAAGEGGASGSTTTGVSGGKASGGGTAGAGGTAGSAAGKGGSAGKANTAGEGGAHSSGGTGGSSSGAPASGGAGGKTSASCSGTSFGGHCYFLIGTDTALDWPSAKTTCEAHSSKSHLVTITSADEQAALVKAFFPSQADTWIGLSLADPSKSPDSICKLAPDQCPFKWVTGEALSYNDWAKRSGTDSEPNYTGSCVRLQAADETWADTGCTSSKNRAICEED